MSNLENICRICLEIFEDHDELKTVFENDEYNISIAKKIYDVSGIFIEKYNCYEKICGSCFKSLEISYSFKKLCQQSDIKLKSIECNDDLYVKNVLGIENGDCSRNIFLKIETESELVYNHDQHRNVENTNDTENEEVFSENDSTEKVEMQEIEDNSKDYSISQVKYDENDSDIEQNCEYLDDEDDSNSYKKFEVENFQATKEASLPFRRKWIDKYDFLKHKNDGSNAICTVCNCKISFPMGESQIIRHTETKKHKKYLRNKEIFDKNELQNDSVRSPASVKYENIHICDICGNKYSTQRLLARHQKYHSDVLDYECEICQKKFRQMMQLKRHMRIHTGEKPYSCKYCNKAIRDYSTKIRHERLHTGERPYVCATCNKGFQYPYVLKNHMKIHTGEKLYGCVVCNKNFTLKKHLTSHLETVLHKARIRKFDEQQLLKVDD